EGIDETNEVIGCFAGSPVTAVVVAPATVQLGASQIQQFTASTTPSGGAVTWQMSPVRGTLSAAGMYTAPANPLLGEQITVKAQSVTNPNVAGTGLVSLVAPVSVLLSPSTASLYKAGTQQFTATVLGAVNTNVHWTLNPAIGGITAVGLYTAPVSISASQVLQVTAISDADSNKFASALITLLPDPVISIKVTPASVALKKH